MKTVTVKDVILGEGAPKICVPMVGKTLTELKEEATELVGLDLDIVEWRVDFFNDVEEIEKVIEAATEIRTILKQKPILFTFRTLKEGGEREISETYYFELNQKMMASGLVDLTDIELFMGDTAILAAVNWAHQHDVKVVMCNHDFDKTPDKEEIISRLKKMQTLNADICKIAVMPNSSQDVVVLLDATATMQAEFADRPIVTMSMGGLGVVSRLAGETFGSAMTFGAAKKASAPGQVPIAELRSVLDLLHKSK